MKRTLLFLLLSAVGFAALLWLAGGLAGPQSRRPEPIVGHVERPPPREGHTIDPGSDLPEIHEAEGVSQRAPPEARTWHDRLSGESIEIPGFSPWLFRAEGLVGLPPADAEHQGVLCRGVEFLVFREPRTRAEALALTESAAGAYDALLGRRFRADEARVFGRLGQRLRRRPGPGAAGDQDETTIRLSGNVHILDVDQGFDIHCEDVTVWVEQERAVGRGDLTLEHEAFTLTGVGLEMERVKEKGWNRVEILRQPVLRIESELRTAAGEPVFDFGPGDFQPARIYSEGRAILIREERRSETLITITFSDRVRAEQVGGRRLDAGRADLVAVRAGAPVETGGARGRRGWKLRRFLADGKVAVDYPRPAKGGGTWLLSATAERLVHDVPAVGLAQTVLEGDPVILMRGQVPVIGPGGRLRASARDRAWIGPVPPTLRAAEGAPGSQYVALRGQARIEHHDLDGVRNQDVLEGDEIDLLVRPRDAQDPTEVADDEGGMVATYFAALGEVRLGGTRVQGTTQRLVADDLDTERPHIRAEGRASRFTFLSLGREEGLVGPDERPASASPPAPPAAARAGAAPAGAGGTAADALAADALAADAAPEGRWVLNRLRAVGLVDIDTNLGGPALGVPAHLAGDEVTYDRVSSRTTVNGPAGAPARITWEAVPGHANLVETPVLVLDRAGGEVLARGGVHAEMYVARGGGGASPFALPSAGRGAGLAGTTLTVRTDERIDIDLVRAGQSSRPLPGAEQVIRIQGPVTAELQSADRVVDRLRAQTLDLGLVYALREPAEATPASAPVARATATSTTPEPAARPPEQAPPRLERFEIDAREMRADLEHGDVRHVQAFQSVTMRSRDGRVSGDRLSYDVVTRRARVLASAPDWSRQPAVAWLGASEERTEVKARELLVDWVDGAASHIEAHAPEASTADVQLYRHDRKHPGQLEWYALTYTGALHMAPTLLQAGRVRVIRRVRAPDQGGWGSPTVLWAPTLRVIGTRLLDADAKVRDIQRIIAEGPETTFQSGEGPDLVEVWGHRFDFAVPARRATLTGIPGRDVTFRQGGRLHSEQIEIVIDLKTNLPAYIRGNRILWNPPERR